MTWYQLVNSLGLLLDIIGVVLLFKYGLPSSSIRETGVFEAYDPNEARKYDRRSYVALTALVAGFSLQIASNFVDGMTY